MVFLQILLVRVKDEYYPVVLLATLQLLSQQYIN